MQKLGAIVLAAGMGTRLKDATRELPKALVPVAGRPLISYALRFLRAAGVDELVVVGGCRIEQLEPVVAEYDAAATLAFNPDFHKGTLYSLKTGIEHISGSFLLFHGDHLFPAAYAPALAAQLGQGVMAMCDTDRELSDDDMKVALSPDGTLAAISKQLTEYTHGYVGITYCGADALPEYREAIATAAGEKGDRAVTEDVMRVIAERGSGVAIGDASGYGWLEVDYQHELARAEEVIQRDPSRFL